MTTVGEVDGRVLIVTPPADRTSA